MSLLPTHLRYFLETARLGSIRKASTHLNVSPSAVYRSIQNLEFDLGTSLFERTSKGVSVTPAGRILSGYAERIFSDGEHTIDRIKTLAQRNVSVSVAGPDGIVPEILSVGFDALLSKYPEVSTLFRGCDGSDASVYLENGIVDIALQFDHQPLENMAVFYARKLPLGVVVPPSHPLCEVSRVSLEDCCNWPLILPDSSWPMRTMLTNEFARRALSPEVRTISSSIGLMSYLVRAGHGVGIQTVIGLGNEIENRQLVHIPLSEGPELDRTLQVLYRRDIPMSDRVAFLADQLASVLQTY